ncbi:hypothetical protein BC629DRAFT_1283069 [Irpex lacteus]|nr:hypothetical protein BC629DRAFT_1283069 [Irpex lacteus]
MTNGERMKRGLPPKKPLFRRQAQGGEYSGSGGSGTCTPRTGVIRVSGGGFNGYLSRRANAFGEYLVQTERGNALSVVLVDECNTAPGGSENLRAVNGFATFPLLGGIQGFSSENPDLRPHTRNYLYVGGVAQSAVGARPAVVGNSFSATTGDSEPSESAIWVVGSDGQVTVRWVNADGSTPANSVVYVGGRNVLAVVGDVEAFVGSVEAASPVVRVFPRALSRIMLTGWCSQTLTFVV